MNDPFLFQPRKFPPSKVLPYTVMHKCLHACVATNTLLALKNFPIPTANYTWPIYSNSDMDSVNKRYCDTVQPNKFDYGLSFKCCK